jgi:cell division septal protein FtsQ
MDKTYQYVISWMVIIMLLTLANRTRLGHVILYYALLLMILFLLAAEYQQITPYFNVSNPSGAQHGEA